MISQVLPKFSQLQVQAAPSCRLHVFGLPNNQSSINNNGSSNARIMTKLPPLAPAPIMSSKRMSATNSSNTESFGHGKIRRTGDFPPSMWSSDQFLTKHDDCIIDPSIQQRHEELKEKVQRMLLMDVASSIQLQDKLRLIDSIQRLGIAYCFESEIQHILHQLNQHLNYNNDGVFTDLYSSAVLFRLMREYGFNISSDIFKKFQDDGGTFLDSLKFDLQGMLVLYEASYLASHGEDILEQAQRFSITCLQLALTRQAISPLEQEEVTHALNWPLFRNCTRLEAIHYIPLYSKYMSCNETLLNFASLDYNIVQAMHKMELSEITVWWNDLDFPTKLPYIRNRVVEVFLSTMVLHFEPQYSIARRLSTKLFMMMSIIDDTYDVYGTVEELELFTDAIERLDVESINALPEFMKLIVHALLDLFSEVERKAKRRPYVIHYLKQEFKKLARAYLVEAKWICEGHVPTVEEYMDVAITTAGSSFIPAVLFAGMEDATEDAFHWACSVPKIGEASAIITRLLNDSICEKYEQHQSAKAIKCYMKEMKITEEEAKAILENQVENAWKDINQELLLLLGGQSNSLPEPVIMCFVNLARAVDISVHNDRNAYIHSHITKPTVSSLFVHPMST